MRFRSLLIISLLLPLTSCQVQRQTSFTITWLNANGDVLEVNRNVAEGSMPSYHHGTPKLNPIKGTTYFFSGWDSPIEKVTMDKTYTATYSTKPNYEAKWVNYDGTELRFRDEDHFVVEGNKPVFDLHFPSRPHEGEKYYAFDGWKDNHDVVGEHSITYDTTYTAQYHETDETSDYDCDGLVDYLDPDWDSNHSNIHYEYEKSDRGKFDFAIDYYDYFINQNNEVYSPDVAKFTAALNIDQFRTGHITFPNEPSDFDDKEYIYKHLGCDNIEHFFADPENYELDKKDLGGVTMAHHTVKANTITTHPEIQEDYNVFFLTFDATCEDNITIWESDLDIGSSDPSYDNLTGEHEEWDTDYHKGFYIAANRVKKEVDAYLNKFTSYGNKILVMSGHSHGAAITNYIAKQYQNKNEYKKFVYTFGCPGLYVGSDSTEVPYIFNIINNDDIVAHMPFSYLGFKRYGQDVGASIENEYKNQYYELTGHNYECLSNIDDFVNNDVKEIIPSRESVYLIDENEERCNGYSYHSSSPSIVEKHYQDCLAFLAKFGINAEGRATNSPYYLIKDDNNINGYNCAYAIHVILFKALTEVETDIDEIFDLLELFSNYSGIADALFDKLGVEIDNIEPKPSYPHRMTSYYLITSCY